MGDFPYVFLDGMWLERSWGGEVKNVSVLVAIGVSQSGYRQILAVSEGAKEDTASWTAFLRGLKERRLKGVELFVSNKCLELVENLADFYPEAKWQRCMVHFYRNVWTGVPSGKVKEVAAMLKAIHAQEDAQAAKEKARQVVEKLRPLRLAKAAEIVENGIEETLSYYKPAAGALALPAHQQPAGTADARDTTTDSGCRRSDGNYALMLVAARLRHVASTRWEPNAISR
jgi:transposase-like protein